MKSKFTKLAMAIMTFALAISMPVFAADLELELANLTASFAGLGVAISILSPIVTIAMAVIGYYLYCVPQEKIAKKLRAGTTWMAYVPFARNVQRVKMANMPMWKLMFVGSTFTVLFSFAVIILVGFIFWLLTPALGIIVGSILALAYTVLYLIETYKYNVFMADTFGFDRALAFLWMFNWAGQIFTYIIAFSKRIQPNGKGESAPSGRVAPPAGPVGGAAPAGPQVNGIQGLSGMYEGAQFKMNPNEEFMIGRDGTLADIVISANSEKISRRHCSIKYLASYNCYEVTDFSLNGTFYGNSRTRMVKDTPTQLPRGTTLVIGDKNNQFKLL